MLFRVFFGNKTGQYHISGRGLKALIVVRRDSNGRRLFGREDRGGGGVVC